MAYSVLYLTNNLYDELCGDLCMSQVKQNFIIRSENIERVYEQYKLDLYVVNRRYQRKLVWTVEEKRSFLDSISRGYPVPLVLLAETEFSGETRLEIIDGMQRLNAVVSFIEQEFDLDGFYFDLETMVQSKLYLDDGLLVQKTPKLDRRICTKIATYILPLSVYMNENSKEIDETFRRINSGGRHLSRQELRQAGCTTNFSTVVRKLSSNIRGDVTLHDKLLLNSIKEISITNKELPYGINVDNVFWVHHHILRRDKVRESRDEELLADILGYMLLESNTSSRADYLDNYYGIVNTSAETIRYDKIETNLSKIDPEKIIKIFMGVFEALNETLDVSGKRFNELLHKDARSNIPRYFQVVFLAFYELMIKKEMIIDDYSALASKLDGIEKHIVVYEGGKWPADSRYQNISAVVGIFESSFRKRKEDDPALSSWTKEFENILMQSYTEQTVFDFKQGFHRLDESGVFDDKAFSKVIKTLTAIANAGLDTIGYVIIGIADDEADRDRIEELYLSKSIQFRNFYITGIQCEAEKYHGSLDDYFQYIIQKLNNQNIDDNIKAQLGKNIRLVSYHDCSVIIFKIESGERPLTYDDKFYWRTGPNVEEVSPSAMHELFGRFK